VKRGQQVELSIQITPLPVDGPRLTAQQLLASDLLGMWQDRMDIGDSITYARELRERAQWRER
jgi:hypothetical protein